MEQSEAGQEPDQGEPTEPEHGEEEPQLDPAEAKAKEIEDDPSANPQDEALRDIKGG